jgi:hypothetical protein
VTHSPRNIVLALLLAALTLSVGLAVGVAPAAAKSKPPCWKTLINDWYDGRIDGVYPIHCYREALAHLPTDVETYSSARDDIKQALQKRITQGSDGTTTSSQSVPPAAPGDDGNGNGPSNQNPSSGGDGNDKKASGPLPSVISNTAPSSADSVPVPLIVLGAVAFLLIVAGATGFITRRHRTRRVQLASAAATQPSSGEPPPSG